LNRQHFAPRPGIENHFFMPEHHPTGSGHNLPVRVTFQFLLVMCPTIELSGRYSASKLMASLPQPGQFQTVAMLP
jgi:hypothetical protein